ncbi:MAG: type II-A CRISPR-associated protein Csn2 [Firmicutes bacterium]|jgi:CRISPR type II-A-associated protein Csn2|nr:type II-A CRISPR-associated protein Csn2 [Bacillota bacterium]
MKFSYKPYNIIFELNKTGLHSLVVEESHLYTDMVKDLYRQMNRIEESWMLSINGTELRLDKGCDLIFSPIDLTFDKKRLQKRLLENMVEEIEAEGISDDIASAHAETISVLDRLKQGSAFTIEFDTDLVLEDYLKWHHVRLRDPEGGFLEQLIEYMGTVRDLTGKSIYILIGCTDYFCREDYEHLEKWVQYQQICVIFLSGRQIESDIRVNEYIIDSDLCEIH